MDTIRQSMTKEQVMQAVPAYNKIVWPSGSVDVQNELRTVFYGLTEEQADKILELQESFRLALVSILAPNDEWSKVSNSVKSIVEFSLRWCPPAVQQEFTGELNTVVLKAAQEMLDGVLLTQIKPVGGTQ